MMTPAPATFRSRLWRFTKRLTLFATLSTVGVGAAGYFGLPVLARQPWARHQAEKAVSRAMGTPVDITDLAWSWRSGLTLRGVSTPQEAPSSFRAESIRIQPRVGKSLKGKLRLTAVVTAPEITLDEASADAAPFRFPRFSKRGFRLDKLEIRDGTLVVRSASSSRNVRIEQISTQGTGRLEKRTFRLDLASVGGVMDGMTIEAKGVLRVTPEGLTGELDVNDPARQSTTLHEALRAAHVVVRKAPALSDPF